MTNSILCDSGLQLYTWYNFGFVRCVQCFYFECNILLSSDFFHEMMFNIRVYLYMYRDRQIFNVVVFFLFADIQQELLLLHLKNDKTNKCLIANFFKKYNFVVSCFYKNYAVSFRNQHYLDCELIYAGKAINYGMLNEHNTIFQDDSSILWK